MADIENNIPTESKEIDDISANKGASSVITLDEFKKALESNLECKGYFDSLCDKSVNKRLDKSIESWKEKNLNQLIEQEINKRYPQKTEAELKFEEKQKELEKAMERQKQLELQIKYQSLMAENNLPLDILDFVAGKDIETTISNIKRFKTLVESYVDKLVKSQVQEKFKYSSYEPPISSSNNSNSSSKSMWNK